jgi:hypothetical protein
MQRARGGFQATLLVLAFTSLMVFGGHGAGREGLREASGAGTPLPNVSHQTATEGYCDWESWYGTVSNVWTDPDADLTTDRFVRFSPGVECTLMLSAIGIDPDRSVGTPTARVRVYGNNGPVIDGRMYPGDSLVGPGDPSNLVAVVDVNWGDTLIDWAGYPGWPNGFVCEPGENIFVSVSLSPDTPNPGTDTLAIRSDDGAGAGDGRSGAYFYGTSYIYNDSALTPDYGWAIGAYYCYIEQSGACCLPDGTCQVMLHSACETAGGELVAQCLGDNNGNGKDDACECEPVCTDFDDVPPSLQGWQPSAVNLWNSGTPVGGISGHYLVVEDQYSPPANQIWNSTVFPTNWSDRAQTCEANGHIATLQFDVKLQDDGATGTTPTIPRIYIESDLDSDPTTTGDLVAAARFDATPIMLLENTGWRHVIAPIPWNGSLSNSFGSWTVTSGNWQALLDNVTYIRLPIEVTAGIELWYWDNICLTCCIGEKDYCIKDAPTEDCSEPNPIGRVYWVSPSIYNKQNGYNPDGVHENPVAGQTNYLHVEYTNVETSPVSGTIKLYYVPSTTAASWDTYGYLQSASYGSTNGNWVKIPQEITLNPLLPGATTIGYTAWTPPADPGDYCLLARLWAPNDDPIMPLEVPLTETNVDNSNNITANNVTVVSKKKSEHELTMRNTGPAPAPLRLTFAPDGFTDYGTFSVVFPSELLTLWLDGGGTGDGVVYTPGNDTIAIWYPDSAWMGNMLFDVQEAHTMELIFDLPTEAPSDYPSVINVDVNQSYEADPGIFNGGVRYQVEMNEIYHVYPCEPLPPDAVAWWPFDTADGPTTDDLAGTVNNICSCPGLIPILEDSTWDWEPYLNLDGNDHLTAADDDELDFGTGDLTIESWIRTDASGVRPICDKRSGGTDPQGYTLFLVNGVLGFQMADDVGSGCNCGPGAVCNNYIASGPNIADNAWHHVAVTVDRDGEGVLYVDGADVLAFTPRTGDISNDSLYWVGRRHPNDCAGSEAYWIGGMDELSMYTRALGPEEIYAIYLCGSSGKCKSTCDCPYQDDFDEDGFITALDLADLIDILFSGAPDVQDPGCPVPRGDDDCDGFTTALDLTRKIDYLFTSGQPPCDPCDQ